MSHASTLEAIQARPVPITGNGVVPYNLPNNVVPINPLGEYQSATVGSSKIISDVGSRFVTAEELALIETPEATRTHQPISHSEMVKAVKETLRFRHLNVVNEEFVVSADNMVFFGLLEVDVEFSGLRFAIGLRNSNSKTMRLALTAGYRVFVCSNMMFKGDFTPLLARHSNKFNLVDQISIGVDKIQRGFEPLVKQIEHWKMQTLTDDEVRVILYKAFIDKHLPAPQKLLKLSHDNYFNPRYPEFEEPTLWNLEQAITTSLKQLDPIKAYPITAKLGSYLAKYERPLIA